MRVVGVVTVVTVLPVATVMTMVTVIGMRGDRSGVLRRAEQYGGRCCSEMQCPGIDWRMWDRLENAGRPWNSESAHIAP
jgi:hypothetical protein